MSKSGMYSSLSCYTTISLNILYFDSQLDGTLASSSAVIYLLNDAAQWIVTDGILIMLGIIACEAYFLQKFDEYAAKMYEKERVNVEFTLVCTLIPACVFHQVIHAIAKRVIADDDAAYDAGVSVQYVALAVDLISVALLFIYIGSGIRYNYRTYRSLQPGVAIRERFAVEEDYATYPPNLKVR